MNNYTKLTITIGTLLIISSFVFVVFNPTFGGLCIGIVIALSAYMILRKAQKKLEEE